MWRHNSTSKPPSWKKTVQVTQYKKSSLFFSPTRLYIDDNRRAWPPIRIFVCLILLLFVTWLLLWWVNLSVERHFYPSRRNRQRYKRSNSQHLGRNKKRISGETLYSLITSTVCVCVIVWKGFLLFFKEKKKSISSGSQKFSNVFFCWPIQHIPIYIRYIGPSRIFYFYIHVMKRTIAKRMSIHSVDLYAIFSSCEWNPTQSRSTLHFPRHFQCCDGESINVLYRLTLDYQCRMHTQVWWGEKVGGRASQWKDPVGPTQEKCCTGETLYFDASEKGPKKKWEEKPLARFSSTQRIKRLQSHTEVNGWVTWMKTRVLPLWELDIRI